MTVGRPAWETRWPQVNRVVEGLRDGLGAALGTRLVGLVSRWLGPPWPEVVARASGWRADQRPDDDGLGAN